jgi:hypothetical protein
LLLVAACPIIIFAALDAYYLGLERRFRECYTSFATKLHVGAARIDDVFINQPKLPIRGFFKEAFQAFTSFSIWLYGRCDGHLAEKVAQGCRHRHVGQGDALAADAGQDGR